MSKKSPEEKAQRKKALDDYQLRMQDAGWLRITAWICPELRQHLKMNRRKGDCAGRLLERLILGASAERLWKDPQRTR